MAREPIGGGAKKILYTLDTLRKIGIGQSAKALSAKNTCKACGLGMGGQNGGMTNELGEFPAVCNKSVQAQSTDIQPEIPKEIFEFTLSELSLLSAKETEQLGRLGQPLYRAADSNHFKVVDWSWALDYAASQFAEANPERSFFYSSGRSSNEAGFVLQLLARIYGTNNINNCSYYCHQATSVALDTCIGTGTATVELADLSLADCIFVIGANPASNHPRLIHQLKACRDRGGEVIVINPAKEPGLVKFALPKDARSLIAGGSEIASLYLQPKIGSDIALFKGIAKALIENNQVDSGFIGKYTSDYESFCTDVSRISWRDIESQTGVTKDSINTLAQVYARAKSAVFAWGMGLTHHLHGVSNVEYVSNIALLRGMIGRPGCGLLPLRGHSNVQGIGTIGVKPVLATEVYEKIRTELGVEMVDPKVKGMDTLACLAEAQRGNMDAALIMGGNLFEATPNQKWSSEALAKIPFKLFLTTTLNKGHIEPLLNVAGNGQNEALILPVVARDEEPEPTTQESMFNFVRLSDGGIQRIAAAKSELDILAELGSAIQDKKNTDAPFDFKTLQSRRSLRKTLSTVIPGMQQLADIDVAKKEFHIQNRLLHEPEFKTPSGKANFLVRPIPNTQKTEQYPYCAMSVRSEGQFNSIIYEERDSYRGTTHRWVVLMAEADMQRIKVRKGEKVDIFSAHGEMIAVEAIPYNLPEGDILLYYPEANKLTGLATDPKSKTPAFKSIAVNLLPSSSQGTVDAD